MGSDTRTDDETLREALRAVPEITDTERARELHAQLTEPRPAEEILEALRACGFTHAHVASVCDVSVHAVNRWATGKNPSEDAEDRLDLLRSLASAVLASAREGDGPRIARIVLRGRFKDPALSGSLRSPLQALADGDDEAAQDLVARWCATVGDSVAAY